MSEIKIVRNTSNVYDFVIMLTRNQKWLFKHGEKTQIASIKIRKLAWIGILKSKIQYLELLQIKKSKLDCEIHYGDCFLYGQFWNR